jgi:hypothetical protein
MAGKQLRPFRIVFGGIRIFVHRPVDLNRDPAHSRAGKTAGAS